MPRRFSVRLQKIPRSRGMGRERLSVRLIGSGALAARLLDQLDLVAVGILHEGDHRGAVLHRARLAGDLATRRADAIADGVDVVDAERDMAVRRADLVGLDAPVERQLDLRLLRISRVAEEREGELSLGIILSRE